MKFLFRCITKPLGCLVSFISGLLVLLLIGGIVLVMLLNHFASSLVGTALEERTGFPVNVVSQDVHLFSGAVDFQGFKVMNPARYPTSDFVSLNELKIKVDPMSLRGDRIVIEEAVVDLDTLTAVLPKNGNMNVTDFVNGLLGTPQSAAQSTNPPKSKMPAYIIKKLTLRIGTVKYFDFKSTDGKPRIVAFNYDRTFTDVTDINSLWLPIATDFGAKGLVFLCDGISSALLNSDTYKDAAQGLINQFGNVLGSVIGGGQQLIQGVGSKALNLFK